MTGASRPSLKEYLDILTRDESPTLRKDLQVDYIILRRIANREDWVDIEFVDGDCHNEKEWFEGPVNQRTTTIQALFQKRDMDDRRARREVYGRRRLQGKVENNAVTGKVCGWKDLLKPTDGDERIAETAVDLVPIKRDSSIDTVKNEVVGSSSMGSPSSADTRKGFSCAMSAKRPKTSLDAGSRALKVKDEKKTGTGADVNELKTSVMDSPQPKFRKMATRSASNEDRKPSERAG